MNTIEPDDRGLVRVCAQCGQRNRLIYERLGSIFRCSKCHAEISPPTEPVEVPGVAKFDSLVARSALPVLVDFWAPWCGPCVEYLRNVCGINLPGIKMILELVNEAERLRVEVRFLRR